MNCNEFCFRYVNNNIDFNHPNFCKIVDKYLSFLYQQPLKCDVMLIKYCKTFSSNFNKNENVQHKHNESL